MDREITSRRAAAALGSGRLTAHVRSVTLPASFASPLGLNWNLALVNQVYKGKPANSRPGLQKKTGEFSTGPDPAD
jgi:hypothetical protein